MQESKKIEVLLITEGTYPYNTGGVSTWAHDLCNNVKNATYDIYAINANVEIKPKYELGVNVNKVIQVPMWSPEEPTDCLAYDVAYSDVLLKRELTIPSVINSYFVPVFATFIREIYAHKHSVEVLDDCFFKMWQFFQDYDYKVTMTSKEVWKVFCATLKEVVPSEEMQEVKMVDVTVAMRWIYRFLIPISIEVPKNDISHITISGIAVLPALALKYKYNTPILLTEHGVFIRERLIAISSSDYSFFLKKMLINFSESITKLVYYRADIVSTVSKFNKGWENLYGASFDKIKVVYNGVDTDVFVPKEKPEHLKGIPTVVAAARIFELKDILTMIRTCDLVRKEIPNVKFIVYGNKDAVPEYTEQCEALIKELKVEDNFELAGFHNEPAAIFSEGDISILTSISEGFPFTVLESMSCGIPVVATDVGGVSEALDETCGCICKPKDYKDISEAVIKLLLDDKLRSFMGENARKKVVENFTTENFIQSFEDIYTELAKKNKLFPVKATTELT